MLVCTILVLNIPFALAGLATVLDRFWNVSCQYSSPVSREKRSYFEQPDFSEPEELFKYLYPLAHLKTEDFHNESQRSAYPPPTLSTWISDILEFWQYECHLRTQMESGDEQNVYDKDEDEYEDVETTIESDSEISSNQMTLVENGSFGNSSSLQEQERPNVREGKSNRVYGTNYRPTATGSKRMASSTASAMTTPSSSSTYDGTRFGNDEVASSKRPRKKLRKKLRTSSTTTTPASTITVEPKTKPEPEVFFQSYGGDIEYFFPLISFGIPFDGEITFLGFHGFKGLFPYK